MMPVPSLRLGALFCVALGALASPSVAQAPMPVAPPPDGAACLCLKQGVDATNANMGARNAALADARGQLDQLDQQLATARAQVNVDNPQAVAQFRQLLEQRDIAAKRAGGAALTDAQAAAAAYNDAVNAYNAQCANRPLPPPPPGPLACPVMR
jgi:hypothetical protein